MSFASQFFLYFILNSSSFFVLDIYISIYRFVYTDKNPKMEEETISPLISLYFLFYIFSDWLNLP